MSGQLVGRVGPRDQGSSLERLSSSQAGKPGLHPGPRVPDSHSFSGLLGRTRSRLQPVVLESPRREGAGHFLRAWAWLLCPFWCSCFTWARMSRIFRWAICRKKQTSGKSEGLRLTKLPHVLRNPESTSWSREERVLPRRVINFGDLLPTDHSPTTHVDVPRRENETSRDGFRNQQ